MLRRTGAALALGLFAAAELATEARAQSSVLVSNTGQNADNAGDLGQNRAQAFTTGNNSAGYVLTSVDAVLRNLNNMGCPDLAVTIQNNSGGSPGTVVGTLTGPDNCEGTAGDHTLTFTAPGEGLNLAANAVYFIVFKADSSTSEQIVVTNSGAEDAGGASGWSIGNNRLFGLFGGGWGTGSNSAYKIAVKGEPLGVTVTPAALQVAKGATATYDVVLNTAPTGDVVITPTSSATAKATVSPATLTFTSTNWNQAQQVTVNGVAAGSASISHQVTTSADATNYPTSMSIDSVAVTVTEPPVISITGGPAVAEGTGAVFTVTSNPAPATDLTVKLSVADFADSDFLLAANEGEKSVTISASQSSAAYTVPTVADSKAELDGDVSVTLLDGTGYTLSSDASKASVTVESDDLATLIFASSTATLTEGAGEVAITASLDQTPDTELFFGNPWKLFPAGKSSAYPFLSVTVTSDVLEPSAAFTVSYDDDVDTPNQEILLYLPQASLFDDAAKAALVLTGAPARMTLTLIDNDATAVSLARVGSGAVTEGSTAEFTVTLGRALAAGEIIDVPLSVSGTGVTTGDWSLALKTGTGLNTGVALSGEATATPSLRFSGAAAGNGEACADSGCGRGCGGRRRDAERGARS